MLLALPNLTKKGQVFSEGGLITVWWFNITEFEFILSSISTIIWNVDNVYSIIEVDNL